MSDGKAGHDNQSLGLAEALGRLVDSDIRTVSAQPLPAALGHWCSGRFPEAEGLPDPDLIIGAGHATHATLLAARRCRGGRAVVLMSPTLPIRCFDLCVAPIHDDVGGARVVQTQGALNRLRPRPLRAGGPGLILLGGPSRHFVWRDDTVLAGLCRILQADRPAHWTLATSRRTPAGLTARIEPLLPAAAELVPYTDTGPQWLKSTLEDASRVWVSEDSVSMVYEALTRGAPTGLIGLDRARRSRVASEIDRLVAQGWIGRLGPDGDPPALKPPPSVLDEAGRCATLILQRWPELRR
ncbi:MAG TPA: ELM1/GtrOC1 family putative glycosyltransferase [Gammaproteobacteria bacterium]